MKLEEAFWCLSSRGETGPRWGGAGGPRSLGAGFRGGDPTHSTVASSTVPSSESTQAPEGHPGKAEPSRAKSRLLPNMPKLVIPSSATKFPPEITVTPPTPTLLSPKGSISEETKQKLKSAILSAQSAANVRKESLCQPALEVLETSSQESSLESDTDEDDDYMDI